MLVTSRIKSKIPARGIFCLLLPLWCHLRVLCLLGPSVMMSFYFSHPTPLRASWLNPLPFSQAGTFSPPLPPPQKGLPFQANPICQFPQSLFCYSCVLKTESHYVVVQVGLKNLGPTDPPTSVFLIIRTIGVCHCTSFPQPPFQGSAYFCYRSNHDLEYTTYLRFLWLLLMDAYLPHYTVSSARTGRAILFTFPHLVYVTQMDKCSINSE